MQMFVFFRLSTTRLASKFGEFSMTKRYLTILKSQIILNVMGIDCVNVQVSLIGVGRYLVVYDLTGMALRGSR